MPALRPSRIFTSDPYWGRQLSLGSRTTLANGFIKAFGSSAVLPQDDQPSKAQHGDEQESQEGHRTIGAMSRRLSEMTDDNIEQGGRAAQKAINEAGFSDDLKRRLEAKIADSNFRNENPAAFAQVDMPVCWAPYVVLQTEAHFRTVRCRTRYQGASSCSAMGRHRSPRRRCVEDA